LLDQAALEVALANSQGYAAGDGRTILSGIAPTVARLGEYLPTPKNEVVADLYPRLGFSRVEGPFFMRETTAGTEDLVTYITDSA
jgi:hypothetical protein